MKFGVKWVHMARLELILRLDGALWLRIFFKPLLTPKRGLPMATPPIEEALVEMCAWGLFAIYICTSAAPCISMHVVILILMLQQSQMQGVQRLHL